jgi:hypothetical protein
MDSKHRLELTASQLHQSARQLRGKRLTVYENN